MEELEKCIWHAFTALSDVQTGYVQKSKLKVLTNNMGNVLGFNKAEEKLDKCNSNELNFEEYLKLLKSEVLADSKLYTSPNAETIKEICWMLYKCKAWEISNQQKLHSNDAFILWKLFNFLCETDDSGCYSLPLVMDRDEIEVLFERFGLVTGQHADQNSMVNVLQNGKNVFLFPKILALFERQYLSRLRDDEISLGLKEIHEEIINDVMKKGFMSKKGNHVAAWKERYFVLKPKNISYYTAADLKDQKGSIEINKNCVVVPTVDKPCRFILHTPQKNYELHVSDMKTKNEWISALQKAIDVDGEDIHFQKIELAKRSKKRIATRQKEAEECLQRQREQQIIQEKMKELEEEKLARAEAETRLQLESALREADKDHLRELEEIKEQLEKLLEEERQAKRDEELVRIAQARVLEEEFTKRDELERLKAEQERLLAEEQSKREGVEEERNRQAALLAEATLQLEKLEREHRLADQQLQVSGQYISAFPFLPGLR